MHAIPITTGGHLHLRAGITLLGALAEARAAGYGLRSGDREHRGRLVAYRLH